MNSLSATLNLIDNFRGIGGRVWLDGDQLMADVPRTPEGRELATEIKQNRDRVITVLKMDKLSDKFKCKVESVSFYIGRSEVPNKPCAACRGILYWLSKSGDFFCAACHPASGDSAVKAWIELPGQGAIQ
jgi:hypothetical protein